MSMSMTEARRTGVLLANLAALATASAVHGQTKVIYVDDDAPLGGNGTNWSQAYRNLQDAFNEATMLSNPQMPIEVEIRIGQGVYRPDAGTLDRTKFFDLPPNVSSGLTLSVLGGFGGLGSAAPDHRDLVAFVSVLSGDLLGNDTASEASRVDNSRKIMDGHLVASLTIDGLVISGAYCDNDWSSAMELSPAHATRNLQEVRISRCVFEDNWLDSGLGAFALYGYDFSVMTRVEDCVIRNNRNTTDNQQEGPAGLYTRSPARVVRTLFENNHSSGQGGAVYGRDSRIDFADCVFTGNTSLLDGSAVYMTFLDNKISMSLDRCTFNHNPSGSSVVAIARGRLSSCIIHDAGVTVPGLYSVGVISGNGKVSIEHCDIEGGQASVSDPQNRRVWGPGNIDVNPMFGAGLELLAGSPCIDAGRLVHPRREDRDILGLARIVDGDNDGAERVDMGAHEFQVECAADFDGSGFVDTDDFDAFVRAFEAGC